MARCTTLWNKQRSPKQTEIILRHLGSALIRPVVTRWNSFYESVKCIVRHQEKITSELYTDLCIPESSRLRKVDFDYLGEYIICLKPVADTLNYLQGETYTYYGVLTLAIVSLKFKLQAILKADNILYCGPIVSGLLKSVDERFKDLLQIKNEGKNAAIAAALHPRFKLKWLASFSSDLKEKVNNLIQNTVSEVDNNVDSSEPDDFFMFNDSASHAPTLPRSKSLAEYLNSPTTTNLSVVKADKIILDLFLKFNTPLPSSAPVERVFSFSTMLNVPKYNRLSDKNFEMRVLLKANIKSIVRDI